MATLTLVATIGASGRTTITAGTGGALGGGIATLLIDNTKTAYEVDKAVDALLRGYRRRLSRSAKPSAIATSGTSVE